MDKDNSISGEAYLGNNRVKYEAEVTETDIIVTINENDPVISAGVYNGIAQREVNRAKGV